MKRILGLAAVGMTLAGCGLHVLTAQTDGAVQRTLTCPCLQDQALHYALEASSQLGMHPTFINTNGFYVTTSDMWGMPTKLLDVILTPQAPAATSITVRANASNGAEEFAKAFTNAFAQVAKL
jgi:hypothetical protein